MRLKPVEKQISDCLDVYTLEEILDYNDITALDLLLTLVENGTITLPEAEPL